ncbi:uncharacterized protein G2W53_009377 [Senna tora]|uniref:Uncharacterized protein n=1 Tax=Senna tora TaxID=362788 RepID=A0A834WXQ8_9FABA|nr:uncharacterized protein G2W53_009377 [Senna tora]
MRHIRAGSHRDSTNERDNGA